MMALRVAIRMALQMVYDGMYDGMMVLSIMVYDGQQCLVMANSRKELLVLVESPIIIAHGPYGLRTVSNGLSIAVGKLVDHVCYG